LNLKFTLTSIGERLSSQTATIPEQAGEIRKLFEAASESADREALLREAGQNDPSLRQLVEQMLEADAASQPVLDRPLGLAACAPPAYQPRWRPEGKEILYFTAENRLMSVDVATAPTLKPGVPKPLFVAPIRGGAEITAALARWDVSPDGLRFLINTNNEDSGSPPITVLLNWTAAFRK
jgi:hypothetical protein